MHIRFLFSVLALVTTLATATSGRTPPSEVAVPQAAAADTLATAKDQTFTRGDATINYRETGKGDAVILVHGYSGNLQTLIPLGNALASDFRVVAMDVRGFGKSSKFGDPKKFGVAMADDVVGLMDSLGIKRAHVVGHSLGALIAANVAARHTARTASVSLVAGPFFGDSAAFTKQLSPWISDLESGKGLVNFAQWLFPKMDPKMAEGVNKQLMSLNDLPSLIAALRGANELALTRAPRVAAVIVAGTEDPLFPYSRDLSKLWPGARFVEVKGADHLTILASPDTMTGIREVIGAAARQMKDAA
jgi:pimeloyl-ACP methyl ester carboxylesterase